jgi:hypothetical protein
VGCPGRAASSILMARRCAFCGGANKIEAEHVWPHWAAELFADDGTFTYYRQFVGAGYEPEDPSSWVQKPFEWKARAVCKSCNNGWMSDLETAAKDTLFGSALSGRGRELPRGGQRTLAAWVLKTAMMVERNQCCFTPRDTARRVPALLEVSRALRERAHLAGELRGSEHCGARVPIRHRCGR